MPLSMVVTFLAQSSMSAIAISATESPLAPGVMVTATLCAAAAFTSTLSYAHAITGDDFQLAAAGDERLIVVLQAGDDSICLGQFLL